MSENHREVLQELDQKESEMRYYQGKIAELEEETALHIKKIKRRQEELEDSHWADQRFTRLLDEMQQAIQENEKLEERVFGNIRQSIEAKLDHIDDQRKQQKQKLEGGDVMGYILNPVEVKGWIQEVRIWLNELDQRYQALFSIIKEFSQNTELEGIAYNQMKKDFLEYHSLAVHGASEAKLSIESDLLVLEEVIGTEYLNEEVLEEQIRRQEKTSRHYENILETLSYLSRNAFLAYYLEPLIKSNRSLLKYSENILARLKEKLERLYEIDNRTRGLFNDASNWFSAVSAIIHDRKADITGKGWRSDGSAKNLLLSSLDAKGVALAVFKDGSELSESPDANKAKIQKLKDMIEKTTGAMPRERNEWLENEVKAMMPYLSEEEKRVFEAMMKQHGLKFEGGKFVEM